MIESMLDPELRIEIEETNEIINNIIKLVPLLIFNDPKLEVALNQIMQKYNISCFTKNELSKLNIEKLKQLNDDFESAIHQSGLEKEKTHFFNSPESDADFPYWINMPFWTIEQAALLSMGKDPRKIDIQELAKKYTSYATEYCERREKIILAANQECFQSTDNDNKISKGMISPIAFIKWAKLVKLELNIPDEFIHIFENTKPKTKETSLISLEKLIPLAQKLAQKTCKNSEDTVYKLFKHYTLQKHANIQAIKQILDVLKEQYHEVNRDVALLIVNVIAQAKYSYDLTSRNNSATSNIARDVFFLGLQIGDDTVRKALREGDRLISNLKTQN